MGANFCKRDCKAMQEYAKSGCDGLCLGSTSATVIPSVLCSGCSTNSYGINCHPNAADFGGSGGGGSGGGGSGGGGWNVPPPPSGSGTGSATCDYNNVIKSCKEARGAYGW